MARAPRRAAMSLAAVGMSGYGLYAAGRGTFDLVVLHDFEIIVGIAMAVFGLVLIVAAALVRVVMPGGLALAIGAMLALQALAIHNAQHLYGDVAILPQLALGSAAALLVALSAYGSRGVTEENQ
ncbi:MAG: hypothetical protein HY654_05210 [Acidobacteria bacterium]|nr:hypothetical protein [Acidobacteriota bacterium]